MPWPSNSYYLNQCCHGFPWQHIVIRPIMISLLWIKNIKRNDFLGEIKCRFPTQLDVPCGYRLMLGHYSMRKYNWRYAWNHHVRVKSVCVSKLGCYWFKYCLVAWLNPSHYPFSLLYYRTYIYACLWITHTHICDLWAYPISFACVMNARICFRLSRCPLLSVLEIRK